MEKQVQNLILQVRAMGIKDEKVLKVLRDVNREHFVPQDYSGEAWKNYPVHIGKGQTVSQPYTVAYMLELLDLKKGLKVLEVGAGSGYNAALIHKLTDTKVFAIELLSELASQAVKNLKKEDLTKKDVEIFVGDGSKGLPEYAPYDRIIVTCAAPKIPQPLIDQLVDGGVIVCPVGVFEQVMIVGHKKSGKMSYEKKAFFRFVPLKGEFGFND
ncbi:protein-L-isoaspartate(D-aspartate) O-methyltransferase [Candidatus Woesearchaeota archaeon]|nr:protein-L-isoaspartate(D-aspartate) O-methyltransferase [Candidatus Woesearchaeota archaeon]